MTCLDHGIKSKRAAFVGLAWLVVMMVLFGIFTQYSPPHDELANVVFFPDVQAMVFVGFGYLMTFQQRAGWIATGHSLAAATLSVLWALLCRPFWRRVLLSSQPWVAANIGVADLTNANFVGAAVLIAFGAVIGRVTSRQLLALAWIEVVFYTCNEAVLFYSLEVADAGCTYIVYMFGAFFGLSASAALHHADARVIRNSHGKEAPTLIPPLPSTPFSDTMAMIGLTFSFVYWPSFNAATLAGTASYGRAVVNSYLSIAMSAVTTVLSSILLDEGGRINMVDVQNAPLSGGIAIGAAAAMMVTPGGAVATGWVAGILSVVGYRVLAPRLCHVAPDTCGILHLHGLPALLGGIVSAVALGAAEGDTYPQNTFADVVADTRRAASMNAGMQILGMLVTVGFAVAGGTVAGLTMHQWSTRAVLSDEEEYNGVPAAL